MASSAWQRSPRAGSPSNPDHRSGAKHLSAAACFGYSDGLERFRIPVVKEHAMDTNTTRAHRSTRRRSAARGRTFLRSLLAGLLLAFGAGASALEAQAPPPEQRTPTVAYNSHPEQQNFLIV